MKTNPQEEVILKDLHGISKHLKELKKQPYVLKDIESACEKLGTVVADLRQVRQSEEMEGRSAVDEELDDIWLELFQLWAKVANIDKNLYPIFTKLTAIEKQLKKYKDTGCYTISDILPLQQAMTEIETTSMLDGKFVAHGQKHLPDAGNPPAGQAILMELINKCKRNCRILLEKDEEMDASLQPILAQMVAIQQKISSLQIHGAYSLDRVHDLQAKLDLLDSAKTTSGAIPAGQTRLSNILNDLYDQVQQMQDAKEPVTGPLRPIFENLVEIGNALEKLRHGKRFTVAPLDVAPLQEAMHAIEANRDVNGVFKVEGVEGIPPGQQAVSQQLSHNYNLIHQLLSVTDSVDESLGGSLDELTKIRANLQQLVRQARRYRSKRGGKSVSQSDLVTLQERLSEFEATHKRGDKIVPAGWKDGDAVPSGQAVLSSIESEVYGLVNELRH
jgi:hypothetical protein